MGLSTHILDTALGRPAVGVTIVLERLIAHVGERASWKLTGIGVTDADGRCRSLLGPEELQATTYRLRFETAEYFTKQSLQSLYPCIEVLFTVTDATQRYHIPLLLTANGYTTYRGS